MTDVPVEATRGIHYLHFEEVGNSAGTRRPVASVDESSVFGNYWLKCR